ncbi:MAG: ABC transporter substrate-binding protein [Microcella pacifica]|jgi:osmoprotectant transport system substrate-binding protein|uniref:ABC transporter substrate-binding protein n=1 Tax=Microcella pacifica TaxID=2591847 RepID=A0A9E5JMV5_9MICO|nr:ABC transporter substrate-binding protein [Microcella pacifica]MBR22904.1 glycine/betaine ABC transporter [Leifsonia sp.]NHF61806.1 ABC transporter substrate-binding protein [Microcella pacifica]
MFTAQNKARFAVSAVAVGALVALAGCATTDPTGPSEPAEGTGETIVIGSFAFPESEILAEMYAIALEEAGFDVETALNLGPRQATIPALEDGSIDLMPEYNGNLLFFYDTENEARSTEEVDAALAEIVPDGFQVLDSSPAQDKDAYVVTRAKADEFGLVEIGDLSALEPFALGANPQFGELGYGIPGLASVYGVTDVEFVPIEDFGGPDTVRALVDDAVQVADIYTTSPAITAEDLVVLEDPLNLIAAQNVLPLLNSAVYSDELAAVLNEISAALSTEDLIALRDRVEGDENVQASVAARDWLEEKGLI